MESASLKWEILPGLPGAGPPPRQYTEAGRGTHAEGLVVRFSAPHAEAWIGNFQCGHTTFSAVFSSPNWDRIVVISGGLVYIVSVSTRGLERVFGGQVEDAMYIDAHGVLLISDRGRLTCLTPDGVRWTSVALAYEGVRIAGSDGQRVFVRTAGEAVPRLVAFDVATGKRVRAR